MSAQKQDELRLKSHVPVVFLLSFDVPRDTRDVGAADAESTESALPCKCPVFRKCVMDPLRRTPLQLSHCFRNRDRRRQDHQQMNVVGYRVGDEDCPAELAGDATATHEEVPFQCYLGADGVTRKSRLPPALRARPGTVSLTRPEGGTTDLALPLAAAARVPRSSTSSASGEAIDRFSIVSTRSRSSCLCTRFACCTNWRRLEA
jgi:hypothetical protein